MKKTLTRMLAVAMLTMVCMEAGAKIRVDIGKFEGGNIIEKNQTDPDDKGLVTVTITVTPDKGYTISRNDIVVVSTYSPSGSSSTRNELQIAGNLTLLGNDPNDLSKARDYSFIVASSLGAWVKEAQFTSDGSKGPDRSATEITTLAGLNEMTETGNYIITADIDATNYTSKAAFKGKLTARAFTSGDHKGEFPVITGLTCPLFITATGATISNIMLQDVSISQSGYVGAIACTADGTTRIYNCGILPTTAKHESTGRSTVESTNNHCGSLVGYLDGYARVINCFSYANVSAPANNSMVAGGLVGYNTTATQQGNSVTNFNNNCKTMVVNCMFYGDIPKAHIKRPVYGGTVIANNAEHKVNNYNYFCQEEISFESSLDNISKYNNTWPVAKKYLTRFEVYRSILNSNRRLCTWWVNGAYNTAPTDADVEAVDIAKWVLDLSIAPYPILKKWGKYPSVINKDPNKRVDPSTKAWVNRGDASDNWGKNMTPDTEGQVLGTITVNISGGDHHSGSDSRAINITAMDTEYKDYCYGKIQLPYYNEIFGNPEGTTWSEKYGDNYTDMVVTGWEITSVTTDGTISDYNSFEANWESGYNFADRHCTNKDLYGTSGRVFAQGGYYYVPEGVTTITIKAHWGKAIYLCNANSRLDRINNAGNDFYNAGTLSFGESSGILPLWPSGNTLITSLNDAIDGLSVMATGSVYDQVIVLVGNYQYNNFHIGNILLSGRNYSTAAKPFTIMSADFDLDNEPDFCFQAGMNNGGRSNFQPIRFDFLMVPDITMAIRKSADYLGMRIICPQGHFEVTETSYMYITQFEYDKRNNSDYAKHEAPMILNGGEFFQLVSLEQANNDIASDPQTLTSWTADRTSYFLMGGNLWMKAFTPGVHGNGRASTRHCAVNAIGGEYPELYLSGMFRTDFYNKTDNPHAYLDGGKFGIVAGAGMESVGGKNETNGGDVTFKINHSLIDEFYGGGINAQRPVTGNINVTIDNSKVKKYCGGPKLGDMSNTKTITTNATGTTFDEYYGGGNGGTNLLRERMSDAGAGVGAPGNNDAGHNLWNRASTGNGQGNNYGGYFTAFTPFSYDASKGYQAEYEFEMLPRTSGNSNVITRSYYYWASFSKTTVAPVTNTITDCTFNGNFYGGGNLGAVASSTSSTNPAISSTLKGNTVVHGSAFGAGYSASATSFKVHDKSTVVYPYRDNAGFIHDGSLDYGPTEYTWIHDIPAEWNISPAPSTTNPTFSYDGKWYCYTDVSLDNLGTVTGNVTLNIEGLTTVDGNVYGGGEESNVQGNTQVAICADYNEQSKTWQSASGTVTITGDVYGGGKGKADSFTCEKAMIGIDGAGVDTNNYPDGYPDGRTNVIIGNGTVNGSVYGGGEIGRVEMNTSVTVGIGDGTGSPASAPEVRHSVFGGGKGLATHGYSALVRGNPTVTVQGNAKVRDNVYGGGQIASVARYNVAKTDDEGAPYGVKKDEPYALKTNDSGFCSVTIRGNAEIGPETIGSEKTTDVGHVFGAGKGILPGGDYAFVQGTTKRMMAVRDDEGHITGNTWDFFATEADYITFVKTLALTSQTDVTIDGNALVKGSVFGGSESGFVQFDTSVHVKGGTIGVEGKGGADFGNVYGGGKGDAEYTGTNHDYLAAGIVKGNTKVTVSQESGKTTMVYHNVYGGGAYGTVGEFEYDATTGLPTGRKTYTVGTDVHTTTGGNTEINIIGGTIGTTGKENGMVFGSSRGNEDNPETNPIVDKIAWVYDTEVVIGDETKKTDFTTPLIRGSVYGGGENGHNFHDAKVIVHSGTIGIEEGSPIELNGLSYAGGRYPYRGNVYGGGCGTDTYTSEGKTYYNFNAGIVLGNTSIEMDGGHVVHNVYGAGAMGSVGKFNFVDAAYNTDNPTAQLPIGKPYECTSGGTCKITVSGGKIGMTGVKMTADDGPDDFGYVFGGGRGDVANPTTYPNIEIVGYVDNTDVTISDDAFVIGAVYGGSESGHVLHDTKVTIKGGQIGCGEEITEPYSDWNVTSLKPCATWTYQDNGSPYDPYAKSDGTYNDGSSAEGGRQRATDGHTFYGNVFGGGSGYYPYAPGEWLRTAGLVEGNTVVDIQGGHILSNVYGGCEMADVNGSTTITMSGGTVGVPRTAEDILANPAICHLYGAGKGDKRIFFNTSTNVASTSVSVTGGTVYGSVYGGGEDGHVLGNVVTTIKETDPTNKPTIIGCDGTSGYDGNVFGGGQGSSTALTAGVVGGNVTLNVQGGEMMGSVYGGGRIASVGTYFAMAKIDDPDNPGQLIDNPAYGKMQDGDGHGCIAISMTGGIINQDVFGGCMGTLDDIRLAVSKDITVELNKDVADDAKGCVVKGDIFGCNNLNSSPEGNVTVHIYKTQNAAATRITNTAGVTNAKVQEQYDVHAVYGGGNQADYVPVDGTDQRTYVIIEGCDRTSIGQVYGGGNAAATPGTLVLIKGSYELGEVFGGGNGAVEGTKAHIGKKTADDSNYSLGDGKAEVNLMAGKIKYVYGGSNTRGDIRGGSTVTNVENIKDEGCCDNLQVIEIFAGGKDAEMKSGANIILECTNSNDWVEEIYAGAQNANILGDVSLTITSGKFGRVFGGNKYTGKLDGSITVNIEENGACGIPVIIGELYGGGNKAPYSVYGYDGSGNLITSGSTPKHHVTVNVRAFTSIGNIFGGGYGKDAILYGSPTVNINEVVINHTDEDATYEGSEYGGEDLHFVDDKLYLGDDWATKENVYTVTIPSHDDGKMGAIGNVYGGGNAAKVQGDTYVNIGTTASEGFFSLPIDDSAGHSKDDEGWTPTYATKPVVGVDIRGNVYGGGNEAEVTGNTNVVIGKQQTTEPQTTEPATP